MYFLKDIELYKTVARGVIQLLKKYNCSSALDIKIIYNILLGLPFILQHGALYKGQYYESLSNIPEEAREQFAQRYCKGICAVDPYIVEE